MDTPMSPKRPRQDDPSQVSTEAIATHPHTTANSVRKAAMLTAKLQHSTHK